MDVLLALLALFNVVAMITVFMPRTFPDSVLPWFVFAFALLSTELAWLWLPLQAVLTLACVAGGALDSTLGVIALLVLAVSWLGLLRSIWLGLDSGTTVESALGQALGRDYRARIPAEVARGLRNVVGFADWRRPFAMPRPGVCPVLLQIHGGAWMIGTKEQQALPLMYRMAANGWICVAANYRLSPSVGFPTHLHDCKAALAWIRTHGREYGMNPDFVAVTGGSAGGHLTALMGLTENRPDLQPGQEGVDTSVQACVPFYGVYDFLNRSGARPSSAKFLEFLGERVLHATPEQNPALWDLASPVTQVHADAPPFMVVHGSRDSLAPVADARLFTRRLRETSRNPVVYVELQGAEHAFDIMHSPRTEHAIDGVQRFLEWVRAVRSG